MIRILDRQGKLNGDLNLVQGYALQWLMAKEIEEQVIRDKDHLEMMAIAANPNTSSALLEHFQRERETQEDFGTQVDWVTPESPEEVAAILEDLSVIF